MDAPLGHRLSLDPWIQSLDREARAAFIAAARPRLCSSGELVFAQGEDGDAFCGVLGGELILTRISKRGQRSTLVQLGTGAWVGELTFLDDAPRMHDAHAVGDTLLAVVPASQMRQLVAAYPGLRDGLVRILAGHTRRLFEAMDQMQRMTPERLLAIRLRDQARTGGDVIKMTQDDIAGLIGVSRQSVNRILKVFERDGIVARGYGGIAITDPGALAQRADGA